MSEELALNGRIEEASLNAWPAREHMLLDGWLVRFAGGYTRRANSVTPLYEAHQPPEPKVAACEALYAAHGLPATFRLTTSAPSGLDELLAARGYRREAETVVMWRDLGMEAPANRSALPLHEAGLDEWLAAFARLDGEDAGDLKQHRALLERIPSRRLLAQLPGEGATVACGLGVLEGELCGLFDIVTRPEARRRGYGGALITGMLQWARGHGGRHAYLQVAAGNTAARGLYAKLGFRERYRYWYWVSAN